MHAPVKIKLHGILGDQIQSNWSLHVKSVGEAMRAIDVLSNKKLFKTLLENDKSNIKYRVLINGRDFKTNKPLSIDNLSSIQESELGMNLNSLKTIDIVPIIGGAGGDAGSILTLIAGVILVVVGIAIGWTGIGPALIIAGIGLIAAGAYNLLSSPPKFEDFREISDGGRTSYLFNGPQNTVREGGPVPLGYGRVLVGSQVIAASYINSLINADVDAENKSLNFLDGTLDLSWSPRPLQVYLDGRLVIVENLWAPLDLYGFSWGYQNYEKVDTNKNVSNVSLHGLRMCSHVRDNFNLKDNNGIGIVVPYKSDDRFFPIGPVGGTYTIGRGTYEIQVSPPKFASVILTATHPHGGNVSSLVSPDQALFAGFFYPYLDIEHVYGLIDNFEYLDTNNTINFGNNKIEGDGLICLVKKFNPTSYSSKPSPLEYSYQFINYNIKQSKPDGLASYVGYAGHEQTNLQISTDAELIKLYKTTDIRQLKDENLYTYTKYLQTQNNGCKFEFTIKEVPFDYNGTIKNFVNLDITYAQIDSQWRIQANNPTKRKCPPRNYLNASDYLDQKRFLVAGTFNRIQHNQIDIDGIRPDPKDCNIGLIKVSADGQLDETFYTNIQTMTFNTPATESIHAILSTPFKHSNGKAYFYIAGNFKNLDGTNIHHLARIFIDGTLDTFFVPYYGSATDYLTITRQYKNKSGVDQSPTIDKAFQIKALAISDTYAGGDSLVSPRYIYIGGNFTHVGGVSTTPTIIHRCLFRINESTGKVDTSFTPKFDAESTQINDPRTVNTICVDPYKDRIIIGGRFNKIAADVNRAHNNIVAIKNSSPVEIDPTFLDGTKDPTDPTYASDTSIGSNGEIHQILMDEKTGEIYVGGNFYKYKGINLSSSKTQTVMNIVKIKT